MAWILLKLTLRVAFFEGFFNEAVGNFDKSGIAFDRSLLVATCGLSGLLLVSLIRRKLFFNYPKQQDNFKQINLFNFYLKYRKNILFLFVLFFIFIATSNVMLGIYQKGSITLTQLPLGLNGLYKWLLLFGLASFSAVILNFEFKRTKKISILVIFLSLLESFFSNVSMLSRGMILNAGALLYGVFVKLNINAIKTRINSLVVVIFMFIIMFVSSALLVNYFRASLFSNTEYDIKQSTKPLFIDRWVGMEGVMAVSSYSNLSWGLWNKALKESYNENENSFFDINFIKSPYINTDKTKHHFISLPGIVAFFFYPGSFCFLFVSMFLLGGLAASIEYLVYKLGGGNLILSALFGQVIAYRFASFGYVPAQSYLLLGALFLNLFIIYYAEKCIGFFRSTIR